jgi:hypothetical protein
MDSLKMKGSMEHCWNNTDREEPKKLRSILSQCHYVHHKSHMDFPGIERMARPRAVETHRNFIKKIQLLPQREQVCIDGGDQLITAI